MRSFVVSRRFSSEEDRSHRLGFWKRQKMIFSEWLYEVLLYKLLQPLSKWFDHTNHSSTAENIPIVFVHGFLCNGAAWWWMRRALAKHGIKRCYTLNLEPIFGNIDNYAQQLKQRVDEVRNETGVERIVVVAHSMGGLVARSYLQNLDGKDCLAGLITIGTPHHGTALAALPVAENIRQMELNSSWLSALNATESEPSTVPVISIYSAHDNIVSPQSSAKLIHAENFFLSGVGHVAMLFSRDVANLIATFINKP